jgi:hypothetical protein
MNARNTVPFALPLCDPSRGSEPGTQCWQFAMDVIHIDASTAERVGIQELAQCG